MNNEVEFPSCWEEVQPAEWQKLLRLRERLINEPGITLDDVKRRWTEFVLKRRGVKNLGTAMGLLLINDIANTLDWQWQTLAITGEDGRNGMQIALAYDSLVNLLPCYGELYGPASYGADITFGEFRKAVFVMNNYTQHHDDMSLLALCGILYRKTEKLARNVRKRVPFNEVLMNSYIQIAHRIPSHLRWGIYAWFANFCEYVYTGTFIIDGKEVCFAPLFERNNSDDVPSGTQDLGMASILYSVAESGVFGNADQTDNTLLLSVLMKMLNDKQQIDNLRKKQ